MRYEYHTPDNTLRRLIPAVIVAALTFGGRVSAQCGPFDDYSDTWLYGQSVITRLNGNTVKLYNETSIWGGHWNYFYNYVSSSFYLNGSLRSSQPWGTTSQIGAAAWQSYEPTLQTYGPGQYYTSALHNAYNPICGWWFWDTDQPTWWEAPIYRPTIGRTDPPPFFLGGATTSGTYSSQCTIFSDGLGAPEVPTYAIVVGGTLGRLDCSTCISPIYTATAPMACGTYGVAIVASYGGFQSEPLYIFNNSPGSVETMGLYGYGLEYASGWEVDYTYKVLDACGNPMNWVEVNESFTSSQRVYPNPTNWPLPGEGTWNIVSWSNNSPNPQLRFSAWGDFVDHIWEQYGDPLARPWAWENLLEDPYHTVLRTNQWFKAGTVVNGYGILIKSDWMWKYIDHGVAR